MGFKKKHTLNTHLSNALKIIHAMKERGETITLQLQPADAFMIMTMLIYDCPRSPRPGIM